MQHMELLAGQAEMRAAELAAAQAAAPASGAAEADAEAEELEEEVEEEVVEEEEEEEEEECEDSQQDAEQEWAARQEAAGCPRALSGPVARLQAEEDAAADSNHASPTLHSPGVTWRDSLPSVMRLPPLRLSPKSQQQQQQQQQQQAAAGSASRHTTHGARRYAPY